MTAHAYASLLGETVATGPGLGSVTLTNTPIAGSKFIALNAANGLVDGDNFFYAIRDQAGPKWEIGVGKYTTAGTLVIRELVLASSESNGGAANFNAPVYIVGIVPVTTLAAAGAGTAPGTLY